MLFARTLTHSVVISLACVCMAQATDKLLSESGPTFRVPNSEPLTFIAFGDERFTDASKRWEANATVRRWMVNRIAMEKPVAVFLNGDVPLEGTPEDYAVYKEETLAWRKASLHIYPALGNHELQNCELPRCLQYWWQAFPELTNRRWYSIQLGLRVYAINLDSDQSLLPESQQLKWLANQISYLPTTVDFVMISMHHPPVADIQEHIEVNHNPRPNEIALRDYLSSIQAATHARFVVSAGHIHNYEHHLLDDVTYLVSGGGGARPYFVERTEDDLYHSNMFPNYHYLKFELLADRLKVQMWRIENPESAALSMEFKDEFEIRAKSRP